MRVIRVIGLCAAIGLGGCSLGRGAPPPQHYVLGGAVLEAASAPVGELAGVALGVRRLRLAPYLESELLVVRRGEREIEFSEFHRWGEPLEGGINRAVAGYLAAGAPFRIVEVAPWPARAEHDYLLELQVQRFEGVAPADPAALQGEAHLLASWEIVRPADGELLARGATDYRVPGWRVGDHGQLVTMLDAGIQRLAADLLAQLAALDGE